MPHIHPVKSPKGGNSSSSCNAISYLDKENNDKELSEIEWFFNDDNDMIIPETATSIIDHSSQGIKKDSAKFFSLTYSFSAEELAGKSDQELKDFVKNNFTKDYTNAVKGREIDAKTIQYVAKLEQNRTYKGTDEEVKKGLAKQGQIKPGDNRHIHILVARNTSENKKISPLTNHKGTSAGVVRSGFDRIGFKEQTEKSFDKYFNHERPLNQSYTYLRSTEKEQMQMQMQEKLQEQRATERDLEKNRDITR